MSETIWSEDFISENPKLASHAIEFLQEMLRTNDTTIEKLQRKVEDLEWEMRAMVERYEE
jgi:predicted ATP-grasp superfamily ATP-dependent carboligase